MRVNIYSQELTSEVKTIIKTSNTGKQYVAIQFILDSPRSLHNTPEDDDRSGVAFWVPGNLGRGGTFRPGALIKAFESAIFQLKSLK